MQALAVASEPYIFWRGDNVEKIVEKIKIPNDLGRLVPANKNLNGPSGNALDKLFLDPLGYAREEAWLCDLLPYSRINPNQGKVINEKYNSEIIKKYNLAKCTIPNFHLSELNSELRPNEILEELNQSDAEYLVTLGDTPIEHFLSKASNINFTKLAELVKSKEKYGNYIELEIGNKKRKVIPLAHPRQAAKLGSFSKDWNDWHSTWVNKMLT